MKCTKLLRVACIGAILAVVSGAAYAKSQGTLPDPSLQATARLHGQDKDQEAAAGGQGDVGAARRPRDANHSRRIRVGALEVKAAKITLCLLCVVVGEP
jgi:hypothetical protein